MRINVTTLSLEEFLRKLCKFSAKQLDFTNLHALQNLSAQLPKLFTHIRDLLQLCLVVVLPLALSSESHKVVEASSEEAAECRNEASSSILLFLSDFNLKLKLNFNNQCF